MSFQLDEATKKPKKTSTYKKRESNPLGAGRKPKTLDWDIVKNLCESHCTQAEIAAKMNIHLNTLKDSCIREQGIEFSQFYKQWKNVGKTSLRAIQYTKALKGDNQMLIWLGKNYLQQSDRQEIQVSVKPFVIEAPNGGEVMKLGVEQIQEIEGETIDVETIEASEKTYYDVEKLEDNIDELATHESNID